MGCATSQELRERDAKKRKTEPEFIADTKKTSYSWEKRAERRERYDALLRQFDLWERSGGFNPLDIIFCKAYSTRVLFEWDEILCVFDYSNRELCRIKCSSIERKRGNIIFDRASKCVDTIRWGYVFEEDGADAKFSEFNDKLLECEDPFVVRYDVGYTALCGVFPWDPKMVQYRKEIAIERRMYLITEMLQKHGVNKSISRIIGSFVYGFKVPY